MSIVSRWRTAGRAAREALAAPFATDSFAGPLVRLLLWLALALLLATGAVSALRARLDLFELLLLSLHRGAAVGFTLVFLFGYVQLLGRQLRSRRLRVGYPLLCLFFVLAPLAQYVFFQMVYPAAAVGFGLLLAPVFRRSRDRRMAAVGVALWLAGGCVLVPGWHLLLFDTLRHDFYHYLHFCGALSLAAAAPLLFAVHSGERGARRLAAGVAIGAAAAALGVSWGAAYRWERQLAGGPPAPVKETVRVDLAAAAAGAPLLTDRSRLTPSGRCSAAVCHKILYDQWKVSPHRFAGQTEPYKHLVRLLIAEKGPEASVFCSRCHTPLLAMLGLADNPDDRSQDELRAEGISCQYCHLAYAVSQPFANGGISVEFGRDYLQTLPDSAEVQRLRQQFIMANKLPHRNLYRKPVQKESGFCGACHRVEMPPNLTDGKAMVLGDTHTPWLSSHSAAQDVNCHSCHMPLTLTRLPQSDYRGRPDELHASPDHRFVGTCQGLALLVPGEPSLTSQYDEVTAQRLRGSLRLPMLEFFYLWFVRDPRLPAFFRYLQGESPIKMTLRLLDAPNADERIVEVQTANNTFAHILPSGPLDLNEIWLDLKVVDGRGRTLAATAGLDERRLLRPDAVRLGADLLDRNGKPIVNHRFWAADRVVNKQILDQGQPRFDVFRFRVPPTAAFPLRVRASWQYRRYNQRMTDEVYGAGRVTFPTVALGSASLPIER